MAAQRSRQRKKTVLEDLDKQVMELSRTRAELVGKNQKLLLERKERKQKLEIAKKKQMQLTQRVMASFLACKVATEELKRCIYLTQGIETRKSVPDLFQNEILNLLQTSSTTTATKSSCVSSTVDMPLLTSGCRHEDAKPPFFNMGNDLANWKHLEGAISF